MKSPLAPGRAAACLAVLVAAAPARAQIVFAPPAPPYIAPNGLFSVKLPPGWEARSLPDRGDAIELRRVGGRGTAFVQVQRLPVAEGARARQLIARAVEERLRKLPHFRELSRRDVDVNQVRGATVLGHYWYQGNAQYPRAVEELTIVLGREAFTLHFECFEPMAASLAGELNAIYGTFVARPANDAAGSPADEEEDPWDKVPF